MILKTKNKNKRNKKSSRDSPISEFELLLGTKKNKQMTSIRINAGMPVNANTTCGLDNRMEV